MPGLREAWAGIAVWVPKAALCLHNREASPMGKELHGTASLYVHFLEPG